MHLEYSWEKKIKALKFYRVVDLGDVTKVDKKLCRWAEETICTIEYLFLCECTITNITGWMKKMDWKDLTIKPWEIGQGFLYFFGIVVE